MTATLTNADGSKRIVLDGEIVVGAGLDYGPLPDGKAWLDATGGAGAGMGGYPAAYFLALENATGLLGIEHIEPGGEHGVLYVSSGLPTWGLIMDANVSAVAAIDGSKITGDAALGSLSLSGGLEVGTGISSGGTISADGNLTAGSSVRPGALGVNFNDLLSAHAPLHNIPSDALLCANLDSDKFEGQHGSYYLDRTNHTGAQLAATISDFSAAVGAIAQPLDADLTLLAGITLAANEFIARSSAGAVAAKPITDFGLSLVDDADGAAARTTLGLVIGTNVQAYDATLAALAGVTSTAGGMLYSTGADAFSNLANPGAASVLTHDATAPVWVAALAKAQQHPQTPYLDVSNAFPLLQRIGSQTAGTGLVVGDQSAALDAGGLTSNVGLTIYADVAGGANGINYVNRSTSSGAQIGLQYLLATSTGVLKRAGNLRVDKSGAWTDGTASTQNADLVVFLDRDGTISETLRLTSKANLTLRGAGVGGGVGVVGILNATTNPSSNPTGGGILYADAGAGKWRGSSGTVTTFGPAEPHCPTCGSDFGLEWESAEYGYLAVCMKCLVTALVHNRTLGDAPYIRRSKE